MKSFGIQPHQVPLRDDGTIDRSECQQMLRNCRVRERRSYPMVRRIKSPGPFDVLFGKGCRQQEHEGNVRLRKMIAECRKTYDKTERSEKHVMVQEVVDTVRQSTGLFLKEDGDGWIVVDDDEAPAKKVGAIFRSLRAQDRKNSNREGTVKYLQIA